ncbi:MAG: AraC family transcriptional regulator, partial [Deltaproteobacteria bacterium]|nr:AraC family transcriptional regulator [Deltaproteobacteria bacterium]MBW2380980.1 AraC family transcriptional regulator [Deltaproteobacteria bacterium]MBW2687469.1 AraC family transcriptional regulator [Deltaproteobacteria bacterium]
EIGFLLGYASVSNFRRAFKSWTGKKLTDFRQLG